ncbi:MAG: hypothetical protein J5968_06405 [Oscillospiraceae bacterium]|nr:hypothetical protein [Oscillospiraceae bacterium]MBP1556305.1 hypothetical protein [Oscillospiraceae bacterium]
MAKNYNVDDILAEVSRKKSTPSRSDFSRQADYRGNAQSEDAQSQFSLKGMTGEFDTPAAVATAKKGTNEDTRTDLPAVKAMNAWAESGKTQVIPAVKDTEEESFQRRRQQKVQQFMKDKNSFEDPGRFIDEEDGEIEDLGSYFGGLKPQKKKKRISRRLPLSRRKRPPKRKRLPLMKSRKRSVLLILRKSPRSVKINSPLRQ